LSKFSGTALHVIRKADRRGLLVRIGIEQREIAWNALHPNSPDLKDHIRIEVKPAQISSNLSTSGFIRKAVQR
jgi:hypothetical protein